MTALGEGVLVAQYKRAQVASVVNKLDVQIYQHGYVKVQ
jgi:hypothetical protein